MKNFKPVISWIFALWISWNLMVSLTFKFTGAPETKHIFGIIGDWMSTTINQTIGTLFMNYGAYATGLVELIASVFFLLPALLFILNKAHLFQKHPQRSVFHLWGAKLTAVTLAGAIFFHLFTPLGIEVLYQGQGDGGSLFYSAVIMFTMSIIMLFLNRSKSA